MFLIKRFTVVVLLILFTASVAGAAALPDVADHWAEGEIRQLVGIGAITGYPDGTYKPEDTITRAEFSSVMWGALGLHEAEGAMFPDTDGHWGQGRIEALIQDGIIDTELFEQHYGPDDPITREEIAMMTVRMLDGGTGTTDIPFTDAGEIGTGFREYVAEAYGQGIITGYPDDTFRPSGTATRAEAAVMAIRTLRIADLVDEEVIEEEPEPEPEPEPDEQTLGEKNALSSALDYLDIMAFSYSGLVEQLEFEGYTHEEAVYAADNCGADWNEQAALKAESYLDIMSFSREGLIDQLEFEGFTRQQAEYGVQAVGY